MVNFRATERYPMVLSNVADPEPDVFGPPGSEVRIGILLPSSKIVRKILIPTV